MSERQLTEAEQELGRILNHHYMAPEVKAERLLAIVEALVNENLAPAMERARADGYAQAKEQAGRLAAEDFDNADLAAAIRAMEPKP